MNSTNKNLTLHGKPLTVEGAELKVGDKLPAFKLSGNDLSDVTSDSFKGHVLVLCVVPSLDTSTCSMEVKKFNEEATDLADAVQILAVSVDLPFAQARWCGAEGVKRVKTASDYKYREFGRTFGTWLPDTALLARAVFIADTAGIIRHVEYVQNLSDEPNYGEALKKIRELL